jgi:hypothetical protein
MEAIGLLGFVALIAASFAVGFRLLRLGSRTHQLPELMIGGAFVFAGGVPGVLIALADDGSRASVHAMPGGALFAAINVSLLLGASMLTFFTWRVFRPSEGWGALLFAGVVAGLAIGHGGGAFAAFGVAAPLAATFAWIGIAFRVAAYTWACTEALREYFAARRRCAIGLADPLVANRMLLWAIGLGAVLAIWVHEGVTLVVGRGPATYLVVALLGFVCAGSLWLAFFPPASYRRRFAAAGGA